MTKAQAADAAQALARADRDKMYVSEVCRVDRCHQIRRIEALKLRGWGFSLAFRRRRPIFGDIQSVEFAYASIAPPCPTIAMSTSCWMISASGLVAWRETDDGTYLKFTQTGAELFA
jgi:hypothetical protein